LELPENHIYVIVSPSLKDEEEEDGDDDDNGDVD